MTRLEETDMGHEELKKYLEDEKHQCEGAWRLGMPAPTKTEHRALHVEHERY